MSTWYLWIKPMQQPFEFGVDNQGRSVFMFNITCQKVPSDTFEKELLFALVDGNLGTFNVDIFVGTKVALPPTGNFLGVVGTAGSSPLPTQGSEGPAYERPTAQIRAHAVKYEDALAKARAAYSVLVKVKNTSLRAA